jgi:hypothetical protein
LSNPTKYPSVESPDPGEAITSHWPAPKSPPDHRAALVALLAQPAHSGADHAPNIAGIELIDIKEQPSSQWLDLAVGASEFSAQAAAFLTAGYVLADPWRSIDAMERTLHAAAAGHESAQEVRAIFEWLQAKLGPEVSTEHGFLIKPDDLMRELQSPDAPPSIFPSLLWRAYRLRLNYSKQFDAAVEAKRVQWARELDNGVGGTNGTRSCLYLMAIAAGLIKPGSSYHSSLEKFEDVLNKAFEKVQDVQLARLEGWTGAGALKPAAFAAPTINTLDVWLRDGAKKLGFDPVEWKDGSPPSKPTTPAD